MVQVKVTDHFVYVKTPYHMKDFVRDRLNGVWSKKEGMYRFPKTYQCLVELANTFPEIQFNQAFMEAGAKLKQARDAFLALKALEDTEGDNRLRPYQRVDVNYLKRLPSAGIFNEPRTGKTPTAIIMMKELGTKKNLVISPASLIWNWAKEFEKWAPEIKPFVVHGTPVKKLRIMVDYQNCDEPSVMIISKDTWKAVYKQWDDFTFDTVFVDEAHFLRNKDTLQSKAVHAVKAKRRYALTGTPTVKHPAEIWGILHFLYPDKFPSYWQFVERYFVVKQDPFGTYVDDVKPSRSQELKELIGFISVQRKRKDVMKWLPDKEHINIYVKMNDKQEKLYEQMADSFMAVDGDMVIDTQNVLTQLLRMRQLCLDPRLVGFDAVGEKTKALLEWLENNPEPVVIMSMFTSYLKMIKPEIEKLGRKVGMIYGEMDNKAKDQAARAFQAGESDILLCNIISAGVGFTLDRAETIIFMDKAWNPADNEQAEDRITPTTPDKVHKHTIISFVCQDSFDEALNELIDKKKSLTDVINEGGYRAIKELIRK